MKTVLISGASGFIARALADWLGGRGHRVVGVSSSADEVVGFDRVERAELGKSIAGLLEGERIDAFVHAANATGPQALGLNREGTKAWHREAAAAGVPLQVLLSSLSAASPEISDYARAKADLEAVFVEQGDVALRLGVVVGDGGMFQRMRESVARTRLVPLPGGGRARIHVLGADSLCQIVQAIVESDREEFRSRTLHLHQAEPYTLREVLDQIKRSFGRGGVLVPVPLAPLRWAVGTAEAFGLRLPITTTNLRGLAAARDASFRSDLDRFGLGVRSLAQLMEVNCLRQ